MPNSKGTYMLINGKLAELERQAFQNPDAHYKMPPKVAIALVKAKMSGTAYRIWIYLRSILGNEDRTIDVTTRMELAARLGVSTRAILRAAIELNDAGFLTFELSSCETKEGNVRDRLHESLGGLKEVITAVGRIDLLTDSELIEVKRLSDWKSALGQVLAYGNFYPTHSKRIHLFSEKVIAAEYASQVSVACLELGVLATFEEVQDV